MPLEPQFAASELRRFLAAIDSHLIEPAQIILLGGSAIALYGVQAGTKDIDTWNKIDQLLAAIERARADTGLDIPVEQAGVADIPINAEDRLERDSPQLTQLTVWKLERHDLALSKIIRGSEPDFFVIEQLHAVHPLNLTVLIERYIDEMGHVIKDPRRLDNNLLFLIQRLYGEGEADRIGTLLESRRTR